MRVVDASRVDGRPLRPMASDWLEVGEGEHEVVFEFAPAATLEGRLVAGDPDGVLHVQMVDSAERVFQTHRGVFTEDSMPLLPNGRFRIEDAPVGTLELSFGTAGELEAGRPRKRVEVEVVDGINPPVVVTGG